MQDKNSSQFIKIRKNKYFVSQTPQMKRKKTTSILEIKSTQAKIQSTNEDREQKSVQRFEQSKLFIQEQQSLLSVHQFVESPSIKNKPDEKYSLQYTRHKMLNKWYLTALFEDFKKDQDIFYVLFQYQPRNQIYLIDNSAIPTNKLILSVCSKGSQMYKCKLLVPYKQTSNLYLKIAQAQQSQIESRNCEIFFGKREIVISEDGALLKTQLKNQQYNDFKIYDHLQDVLHENLYESMFILKKIQFYRK